MLKAATVHTVVASAACTTGGQANDVPSVDATSLDADTDAQVAVDASSPRPDARAEGVGFSDGSTMVEARTPLVDPRSIAELGLWLSADVVRQNGWWFARYRGGGREGELPPQKASQPERPAERVRACASDGRPFARSRGPPPRRR